MSNILEIKTIGINKWVVFNDNYNEELSEEILLFLNSYQRIQFGINSIPIHLPANITHIKFGEEFNQPINSLPSNQKYYCDKTNSMVESSGVTHISFNKWFNNQSQNQMEIETDGKFNHPVENLPNSLTHLKFGKHFNQPIDNLPPSLMQLELGDDFNQPIDNLPRSLVHLEFSQKSCFNKSINNLPVSLKYLRLGYYFNQPVTYHTIFLGNENSTQFLITIINLFKFDEKFNQPVDNLPESLKTIVFGWNFNQSVNKHKFSNSSVFSESLTNQWTIFPTLLFI